MHRRPTTATKDSTVLAPEDTEVVQTLKRYSDDIRSGIEITVNRGSRLEHWRYIIHPRFKDTGSDTAYFCVSSHGRLVTNGGKITDCRTCSVNSGGYPVVGVYGRSVTIHTIVCRTFNGPMPQEQGVEYTVDHIDGDRRNSEATNLRWANWYTQMENRSKKRTSPSEPRILVNPPKQVKMVHKKPPTKKRRSLEAYELILSGVTRVETAEIMGINPVTVLNYVYLEYRSEHALYFRDALKIDARIIEEAYLKKEEIRALRSTTLPAPTNDEYSEILHSSLTARCTDPELGARLISKLYFDLVVI